MFQKPSPEIALNKEKQTNYSHDEVETVVGPSVVVEGDFASEGNIIVKGTVSGSVKTSRLLTVEKGAKILASIRAGSAVVAGSVRGNVKVDDRLDLLETSQIAGDIICQVLTVAPGALLQGKITMKGLDIIKSEDDSNKLFSKLKKVEDTEKK